MNVDWQDRIVTSPDTLFGRPRIAGSRIGVDFILDLMASGWSSQRILDELTPTNKVRKHSVSPSAATATRPGRP
jgi:uncharacterized protein (DUF433 family)